MENLAKKKLDNLMKESKIRDREDPDSFTIAALPPSGNAPDKGSLKVKPWLKHTETALSFSSIASKSTIHAHQTTIHVPKQ